MKNLFTILVLSFNLTFAGKVARVSSIEVTEIKNFSSYSPEVKNFIAKSLSLTKENLTYLYGGNSPKQKGMDCSGTTQYAASLVGLGIPRQANYQYKWLKKIGRITDVTDVHTFDNKQLQNLKPGDMLFWSGTYKINRRITHNMIYLGIEKKTGKPIMFGSSDGRRHNGKRITGVSVFDFKLPRKGKRAKFVAFGTLPLKKLTTSSD